MLIVYLYGACLLGVALFIIGKGHSKDWKGPSGP